MLWRGLGLEKVLEQVLEVVSGVTKTCQHGKEEREPPTRHWPGPDDPAC